MILPLAFVGLAVACTGKGPAAPAFEDVPAVPSAAPAASVATSTGPVFYDANDAPDGSRLALRPDRAGDDGDPSGEMQNGRQAKRAFSTFTNAGQLDGLDEQDVLAAQRPIHAKIDGCVARMLRRHDTLGAGTLTLDLEVDATGALKNATVTHDDFQDDAYASCVTRALRAASWPKPASGTKGKATIDYIVTVTQ